MKIPFDHGQINIVVKGDLENQLPLFILPGGPGISHKLYEPHCDQFVDNYCVIYFDPPSCGDSSYYPPQYYHIDKYIATVEAIRHHLSLDKICLLGISYGAMAGLKYITQFHPHITSAILLACAPHYCFLEMAKSNLRTVATTQQQAICQHLWQGSFKDRDHAQKFFDIMAPLYSKRIAEGKKPPFSQVDINVEVLNSAFKQSFWHIDLLPALPTVTCPILALTGDADWIIDPKLLALIEQQLPQRDDIYLQVVTDCGHSISGDQPELFKQAVSTWLDCTSGRQHYQQSPRQLMADIMTKRHVKK